MPYRNPAEMAPEEQDKLLYEKPWWKFWSSKRTNVVNGQKYAWNFIKLWKLDSMIFRKENCLYYTTKGTWVFDIWTYRHDPHDLGVWNWFLYSKNLEDIRDRLKSNKNWNPNEEARLEALRIFKQLVDLKDGKLSNKGEKEI